MSLWLVCQLLWLQGKSVNSNIYLPVLTEIRFGAVYMICAVGVYV